jgi:hypothetical protein
VAIATGQLLLFLDDDIEALPPLVESHARVHRERPGSAVMDTYPPKLQRGTRFFDVEVRSWWEDKFYQMSRSDHRFTYQDLLSGNLSLDAELFARLAEGVTRELGGRADNGLGPYTSLIKAAFMGGFTG